MPFARFDGAKDDGVLGVLHETIEKDKEKKLILGGFKSLPLVDAKDMDVSPLHVIFDLKGVLVRKEFFKINHLLLLPFNLVQGPILLGKSIIPRLALKEFLRRCLKQFTIYIWTSTLLANMNAYLRKIVEEMGIKMGKHFPIKPNRYHIDHFTHDKLIYHNNLFDFFPRYLNTHLGNTLLVDDTFYKTYLNLPFNAIFVESFEYVPKEDNYLMKILLPYLEFFHYSRLSVPTFVELYPFDAIGCIKENNVRFRTLFKKCTMACCTSFYRNHSTSVVNSPNVLFCSFLPMLFWIVQSH